MNLNYFSTECVVNPSSEFDEIIKKAKERFEEVKNEGREVWLVYSRHYYSEGYWIEFKKPSNLHGHIVDHFNPPTKK